MQVTDELFDSQTPTCSNYDSPSASRDNSIDIANYKQVLGQLQKRYDFLPLLSTDLGMSC
jgi:hypothetical protein